MPKITKRTVEAACAEESDLYIWDDALKGFGLRVKPTGIRSYIVQYRNQYGRSKRVTLGQHGVLTAEEARVQARHVLADALRGTDTAEDRQAKRAALTIEQLCDRYLAEHAEQHKKASSVQADRRNIRNHIKPQLGKLRVPEITRADIDRFMRQVSEGKTAREDRSEPGKLIKVKGGTGAANRCLALLSKMLNLAERWSLRPEGSNPCHHVTKYREHPMERFLSAEELARLAATLNDAEANNTESPSVIAALRLLLLTGARLSEILTLQWAHVDFERMCLMLPDSKTGSRTIYLPPVALQLLERLRQGQRASQRIATVELGARANPYVIAGTKQGRHLVDLQKPWRRIRKAAKLDDVRIHDLRHSFASVAAASGLSLPVIGALLGHKSSATTARYAHLAADPLREAASRTATSISRHLIVAANDSGEPSPGPSRRTKAQ